MYRGQDRVKSYGLIATPGEGVALVKRGSNNSWVLSANERPSVRLDDGADHEVVWTREPDGVMVALIDGREVLRTGDRGEQDPFDGFTLINHGGEYLLRSISIDGSQ